MWCIAGLILLMMVASAYAGNLSMSVTTSKRYIYKGKTLIATAGTDKPAIIYVLVTDPNTGEGVSNLTPGKVGDTVGKITEDLDLPRTGWTLNQNVPEGGPKLRILTITNRGNGLYEFFVLPMVGQRKQPKKVSPWIKGEYHFIIGYLVKHNEVIDQGYVIGTLVID